MGRASGEFTNELEIRVVGMSRSGNHAIIDWLLAQAPGRTCFLNCAEAKTNPFVSARPLGPGRPGHRASFDGFDLAAESRGSLSRKDLLLHSYEDTFLGPLCHPRHELRRDEFTGASRRRIDVLILRDPFNLFASRLAAGVGDVTPVTAGRIWVQHAREFIGAGRARNMRGERVMISYNAWASSRAYRRQVAERIGVAFDDSAARRVPATAGGSSFDGTRHDGRAEAMAVFDRWRQFSGHPRYRQAITPDAVELAARIFGAAANPGAEDAELVRAA